MKYLVTLKLFEDPDEFHMVNKSSPLNTIQSTDIVALDDELYMMDKWKSKVRS